MKIPETSKDSLVLQARMARLREIQRVVETIFHEGSNDALLALDSAWNQIAARKFDMENGLITGKEPDPTQISELARIAHTLGNPLVSIRVFTDYLKLALPSWIEEEPARWKDVREALDSLQGIIPSAAEKWFARVLVEMQDRGREPLSVAPIIVDVNECGKLRKFGFAGHFRELADPVNLVSVFDPMEQALRSHPGPLRLARLPLPQTPVISSSHMEFLGAPLRVMMGWNTMNGGFIFTIDIGCLDHGNLNPGDSFPQLIDMNR